MKHILFSAFLFVIGSIYGQVHPEDYTYSDNDTLIDTTVLRNEFSFHIIPIYQIFSGSSSNYNVLFQYKRQIKLANRAVTASLFFHEGSEEYNDSSKLLPKGDSIFFYHGVHQTSYIGGMLGYEWFTPINENWKLFYGGSILFFYGRDMKEAYKYRYNKDSLSAYYSYDSKYKTTDTVLFRSKIYRPGVSIYGGVEYKFNKSFGISLMAVNNIYYDIINIQMPVPAKRSEVNFDLLRIFLMLKVYF
jgi:hypothetical protein